MLPAGTPGAAMSAQRISIRSASPRARRGPQLLEKRLVIVDRDDLGAQRIRQHQRRAPAAAAEVERTRRRRQLRQAPQRRTRAGIAPRPRRGSPSNRRKKASLRPPLLGCASPELLGCASSLGCASPELSLCKPSPRLGRSSGSLGFAGGGLLPEQRRGIPRRSEGRRVRSVSLPTHALPRRLTVNDILTIRARSVQTVHATLGLGARAPRGGAGDRAAPGRSEGSGRPNPHGPVDRSIFRPGDRWRRPDRLPQRSGAHAARPFAGIRRFLQWRGLRPAKRGAMPIVEHDPWRMQYFRGWRARTRCSSRPRTRRLRAVSQVPLDLQQAARGRVPGHGLRAPRHGAQGVPGVLKPVYNMRGMGAGSRIFAARATTS